MMASSWGSGSAASRAANIHHPRHPETSLKKLGLHSAVGRSTNAQHGYRSNISKSRGNHPRRLIGIETELSNPYHSLPAAGQSRSRIVRDEHAADLVPNVFDKRYPENMPLKSFDSQLPLEVYTLHWRQHFVPQAVWISRSL